MVAAECTWTARSILYGHSCNKVSVLATITSAAAVSQSSVTSVLTTTLPPDPEMEAVFR